MVCCKKMDYYLNCVDFKIISYIEKFDEYGIPVSDGGSSHIIISNCPWCGSRLPDSKRERWFDEIEQLGFEDPDDEKIPEKYTTSAWFLDSQ